MVMEKARPWAKKTIDEIGRAAAKVMPDPDFYTLLGGFLAWTTVLFAYYGYNLVASLMIPVSAFVDALDGSVARLTRGSTKLGEFLDSVVDRLSDTAYFLTLYMLGLPAIGVVIGIGLAVTISYVRAKGELVGVEMRGVGLMERGDRIATIFVLALLASIHKIHLATILLWLMIALMAFTVVERSVKVAKSLKSLEAD
ncbi:MAG: CDP-alcohol phosphatidyltransferase family protein [Crenarchaeota archaeon]|nr:CDP-alcohol phosphatidyltransferase family protein [Thermoproteota archaeon]